MKMRLDLSDLDNKTTDKEYWQDWWKSAKRKLLLLVEFLIVVACIRACLLIF
jgi:hypothetical protein